MTVAGYLGNYFSFSMFWGVDFLFGSIATLAIAVLYGSLWGAIAAAIASSYTYLLWSHPYAALNFTLEAALVGYFVNRYRQSLVLVDAVYWLLLGIPLTALCYGGIMGVDVTQVKVIALKQAVNGTFNALAASALVMGLTWIFQSRGTRRSVAVDADGLGAVPAGAAGFAPRLYLRHLLGDLLLAFVFLPVLLLLAADARQAVQAIETRVTADLMATAGPVATRVEDWYERALDAAQAAARPYAGGTTPRALPEAVEILTGSFDALLGFAVLDDRGEPTTLSPALVPLFETDDGVAALEASELWARLADAFLADAFNGDAAAPSEAAAGAIAPNPSNPSQILAAIAVPLGTEAAADGAIAAVLDASRLQGAIVADRSDNPGNPEVGDRETDRAPQVVLADGDGRVLAADSPDLALLETFDPLALGDPREISAGDSPLWQVLPQQSLPLIARYKQSAYWQATVPAAPLSQVLWTGVPARPYIDDLQRFYVNRLALLWAIAGIGLGAATLLSRQIARPLRALDRATADLPERIGQGQPIQWPHSWVAEFDALAGNFRRMALSLADRFREIQQARDLLEDRVAERTRALSATNANLAQEVRDRQRAEAEARQKAEDLTAAVQQLQTAQTQLVQTEKMSSLGNLVAGVAHEINNPVNFIHGNLFHAENYARDLLELLAAYQECYPDPPEDLAEQLEEADLAFMAEDFPKSIASMRVGAQRIRGIVTSLRNFSRIDEAELKAVDLHEGIESTLVILHNRLKPKPDRPGIELVKRYGELPLVECYAGHLNQVFMNLLVNAIDALEEQDEKRFSSGDAGRTPADRAADPSRIEIETLTLPGDRVRVIVRDNGPGIPDSVLKRAFDPFFTTKPVGKGTGLGLSISRQIVTDRHGGELTFERLDAGGTAAIVTLPRIARPANLRPGGSPPDPQSTGE